MLIGVVSYLPVQLEAITPHLVLRRPSQRESKRKLGKHEEGNNFACYPMMELGQARRKAENILDHLLFSLTGSASGLHVLVASYYTEKIRTQGALRERYDDKDFPAVFWYQ